jgi:hypothetical protein
MKSPSELAYFLNSEQLKAIKGSKYVRESRLYLLHFQQNMGSVRFAFFSLLMLIRARYWYHCVASSVERLLQIRVALRNVRSDIVLLKLGS